MTSALTFALLSPLKCNFGLDGEEEDEGEEEPECLRQMATAAATMTEEGDEQGRVRRWSHLPQPLKRGVSASCLKHKVCSLFLLTNLV